VIGRIGVDAAVVGIGQEDAQGRGMEQLRYQFDFGRLSAAG
jgi:hypothetical protein